MYFPGKPSIYCYCVGLNSLSCDPHFLTFVFTSLYNNDMQMDCERQHTRNQFLKCQSLQPPEPISVFSSTEFLAGWMQIVSNSWSGSHTHSCLSFLCKNKHLQSISSPTVPLPPGPFITLLIVFPELRKTNKKKLLFLNPHKLLHRIQTASK